MYSRSHILQQEKPWQWEARTSQLERSCLLIATTRESLCSTKTQCSQKNKQIKLLFFKSKFSLSGFHLIPWILSCKEMESFIYMLCCVSAWYCNFSGITEIFYKISLYKIHWGIWLFFLYKSWSSHTNKHLCLFTNSKWLGVSFHTLLAIHSVAASDEEGHQLVRSRDL